MKFTSKALRQQFLDYFKSQGHQPVASSPLLPKDDPTLLFVNAGMVQFKDVFTGREKRPYTTATSSQKCVRAGGKHNDLENVGRTARHHTFFEMLGNFSFGAYFKEDACRYAWEFLTKVLQIDPNRLSVTVFAGEDGLPADEEAERIWQKVGVPKDRISRQGAKDNFWAMGDTGPCGPCTEIHYDRRDIQSKFGGDDAEGDQLMELWNLVFMQFDRAKDGTLKPLPAPSVDTGMGLERLCTVMNQLNSNYDSDLFQPMIERTSTLSGKPYLGTDSEDDVSLRVVADHARATSFLIADGVLPSNEGRGYVLRRIMRRAIRHGARLGLNNLFFYDICQVVVETFQGVYSELKSAAALIDKMVRLEEETFRRTLDRGLLLFDEAVAGLKKGDLLSGETVFRLHETYGFPTDLTQVLAEERGLQIDWPRFEQAKAAHEKASASGLGLSGVDDALKALAQDLGKTDFVGDRQYKAEGTVLALLKDNERAKELKAGDSGLVILDRTPFYGEGGGQVGDCGTLKNNQVEAIVEDTKKIGDLTLHWVKVLQGTLHIEERVVGQIDQKRREDIRRHHSVTHLLHAALREILGPHVIQKGSHVAPDKLRFDFAHFEALDEAKLLEIEDRVNAWILENGSTHAALMTLNDAKAKGAMALFGEKYGDQVRVVQMGDHSIELCGGTHVHHTGDIGGFFITSEGPLAAGIRRIEAVAGQKAIALAQKDRALLGQLSKQLSVAKDEISSKVAGLSEELKSLRRELDKLRSQKASQSAQSAAQNAREVAGIKVISERVSNMNAKDLQVYADKLRDHLGSGVVVLGVSEGDKCSILVALTKDLVGPLHAGKLVAELAKVVQGKGGGRPDFAQAGGTDASKLDEALAQIDHLLAKGA